MAIDFTSDYLPTSVSDALNNIQNRTKDQSTAPNSLVDQADLNNIDYWRITGSDWYKSYPYQFVVEVSKVPNDEDPDELFFTLPIPPQSVTIEPVLPGQVTPTVGGIVEEISAVALWHINLSGTMGTAVSRDSSDRSARTKVASFFRQIISTTGLLSGISAELNGIVSKANAVTSALSGIGGAGSAGAVTGALNDLILPPIPFSSSAVDQNSNGFTETQELQKFFYIYNALKSSNPSKYNLFFINYKTHQRWQVQIKKYPIKQSASNPNLYRYDIAMVGWNCIDVADAGYSAQATDRFGPGGDLASVNTVGLGAVTGLKTIGHNLNSKFGLFRGLSG